MKLKSDFAASIRKQLDRYPVWEPGAPLGLGDYGVLRDKTLHILGNIRSIGIEFRKTTGNETTYQFASNGTHLTSAQASGSVTPPGLGTGVNVSMELQFKEEHGIFIKALRSRVVQMADLRDVAIALRNSGRWEFSWKFVTEVRDVHPGTIIMGSSAGSTLRIEGSSDLLEQFNIGSLETKTGLSFTGEAALQVVGVQGPILMDLSYLPVFWGGDIQQAVVPGTTLPTDPYLRLETHTGVEDD
jgi:hypothetical protein